MVDAIQAVRGMNDVLPHQTQDWRFLERSFANTMLAYGYEEIRFPILEKTQLFKRSIGDVTDIVEKEMYTFDDRNGESMTLRPEGTAGCLRACLEHGLLRNQLQKLWYNGPMFRHEKPQKGRYRQFNQLGVEVFGIAGIGIEIELILICQRLWKILGLSQTVQLQINTLGTLEERQIYRQTLVDYFTPHFDLLDDECQKRLSRSPLRILDSKNPQLQDLIARAPKLFDVLGDDSRRLFSELCSGLDSLGISYVVNPFLVRGLDYYGHLVFEWVTDYLGSQATVCAGGRYDKLVYDLSGLSVPAIGFAMGAERLLLLRDAMHLERVTDSTPSIFMISSNANALQQALLLTENIHNKHPDWQVNVHTAGGSFKSQFKKADKSGARFAVIIGEDELHRQMLSIKDLRLGGEQQTIPQNTLSEYIQSCLVE